MSTKWFFIGGFINGSVVGYLSPKTDLTWAVCMALVCVGTMLASMGHDDVV